MLLVWFSWVGRLSAAREDKNNRGQCVFVDWCIIAWGVRKKSGQVVYAHPYYTSLILILLSFYSQPRICLLFV